MIEASAEQAMAHGDMPDVAKVTIAMTKVERIWGQFFLAEQQRIVKRVVEKAIVTPANVELRLYPFGQEALVNEFRIGRVIAGNRI